VLLQHLVSELQSFAAHAIEVWAYDPDPLNPDPAPPTPQVATAAGIFMSWIKWGAITLVFALGFVGIAAIAGGRVTGNLDWSKYGQRALLLGGVLGVLFGSVYQMIQTLSGI
jgi:hypothetical protein